MLCTGRSGARRKPAHGEGGTECRPRKTRAWHEIVVDVLKRHEVRLVTYVPDNVLRPLIDAIHADPFFTAFARTREEEALGINAGAWMGGLRGILLMQTSGFATLANVIASLAVPFQIPVLMMVSERGTLGEFNIGQSLVARTMRPVLDAMAIEKSHADPAGRGGVHPGPLDPPGGRDPGAGLFHPVAAADRRQSVREVEGRAHGIPANHPANRQQAKVMNRFDITKRMVALLQQNEAVIGGIGYTNFDLWAAGQPARRISTCWAAWGWPVPIALGVALAQPRRKVIALEGDGSILMQLGSLATVAGARAEAT